jgi:hypothetical protein
MPKARLPAPWTAEKIAGGYVVRDANVQALAYVYSRATESDAMQAKVLTDDEARRVAMNIAKLPDLLTKAGCLMPSGVTSGRSLIHHSLAGAPGLAIGRVPLGVEAPLAVPGIIGAVEAPRRPIAPLTAATADVSERTIATLPMWGS